MPIDVMSRPAQEPAHHQRLWPSPTAVLVEPRPGETLLYTSSGGGELPVGLVERCEHFPGDVALESPESSQAAVRRCWARWEQGS